MTFLALFWSFLKVGFTSFGGMSMIPLINSEMLSHGWMTIAEVADIVAIAEMTPGPIGLNCATFAGLRVGGIGGALAANLGILSPTFTIGVMAALFFEKFRRSRILQHMMMGVRPACVGIIWSSVGIGALACYLLLKRKWSIPSVIGIGAVLGVFTGAVTMLQT